MEDDQSPDIVDKPFIQKSGVAGLLCLGNSAICSSNKIGKDQLKHRKRHSMTSVKANKGLKVNEDNLWRHRLREDTSRSRRYDSDHFEVKLSIDQPETSTNNQNLKFYKSAIRSVNKHNDIAVKRANSVTKVITNANKTRSVKDLLLSRLPTTAVKTSQELLPQSTADNVSKSKDTSEVQLTDQDSTKNAPESGIKDTMAQPNTTTMGIFQPSGSMGNTSKDTELPYSSKGNMDLIKEEIANLEKGLQKATLDTMEYYFKELKLEMKKDSLRLMQKMSTVSNVSTRLEQEISVLKTDHADLKTTIANVKSEQVELKTNVENVTSTIKEVREEVKILKNVVAKQALQIKLLKQLNEDKEVQNMRNEILIQGLDEVEEEDSETLAQIITDFFTQSMKIRKPIHFSGAKQTGNQDPRLIQLTLNNVRNKGVLFKHVKNLKGLKNNKDEGYYINECLPLAKQEYQRKRRNIIREDTNLSSDLQADFTWKKGDLFINNKLYTDPVNPPSVQSTVEKMDETSNNIIITKGELQKNEGCRFIGYSAEVSTLSDVDKAYTIVTKKHADALHVMCAYMLPGTDHMRQQSHCDDGEFGGGRCLFKLLKNSNITHRASFVVRYYGGKHLGP